MSNTICLMFYHNSLLRKRICDMCDKKLTVGNLYVSMRTSKRRYVCLDCGLEKNIITGREVEDKIKELEDKGYRIGGTFIKSSGHLEMLKLLEDKVLSPKEISTMLFNKTDNKHVVKAYNMFQNLKRKGFVTGEKTVGNRKYMITSKGLNHINNMYQRHR